MKKTVLISTSLVVLALCGMAPPAFADSNQAMCEVRKDGQTKQGKSGPCTFSQRQGYIDLDLRNGEAYSLAPGGQPSHFKDQKGNKVVRTQAGGNTQEFKWEGGKKVVVTFGVSSSGSAGAATPHGGTDWDRGCADAKAGSYDRSRHNDTYEQGWQSCKNQSGQQSAARGAPSKQEQACLAAVSRESNNGEVTVLNSEFSQANTLVMIGVGSQRAPWRCLVSNSGVVQEVMFAGSEGRL